MTCLLLLLAVGIVPMPDVADDRVDVAELNHLYDDEGKHVLDQWVFWRWSPSRRQYVVIDWRKAYPRDHHTGDRLLLHDHTTLRRVQFKSYRETWLQDDPEVRNRRVLPKDDRRKLSTWPRPLGSDPPSED